MGPKKLSPFISYMKEACLNVLVKERPKSMPLADWMTFLFCVEERPILITKAQTPFKMPGTFMFEGVHPLEGVRVPRNVKRGHTLFIRKDSHSMFFEVENASGLFRLTEKEWEGIKNNVELPSTTWPITRAGY